MADSSFILLVNGTFGSPPATGVFEYLLANNAKRMTTVSHPLMSEDGDRHEIVVYESSQPVRRRSFRLPTYIPYTYPLDVLVPPRLPRADAWIAFNNLLCARGLLERQRRRVRKVIYWAVDFVPDRFGAGSPLTRAYDLLDAHCCRRADLRVESPSRRAQAATRVTDCAQRNALRVWSRRSVRGSIGSPWCRRRAGARGAWCSSGIWWSEWALTPSSRRSLCLRSAT